MTAPATYEILIRGTESGEIAGAHVVYFEPDGTDRNGNPRFTPGLPKPLHLAEVEEALTAGLYATGAQFTRMEAEIEALKAEIEVLKTPAAQNDPAAL